MPRAQQGKEVCVTNPIMHGYSVTVWLQATTSIYVYTLQTLITPIPTPHAAHTQEEGI